MKGRRVEDEGVPVRMSEVSDALLKQPLDSGRLSGAATLKWKPPTLLSRPVFGLEFSSSTGERSPEDVLTGRLLLRCCFGGDRCRQRHKGRRVVDGGVSDEVKDAWRKVLNAVKRRYPDASSLRKR